MGEVRIAVFFVAFLTTFAALVVALLAALPAIWRTRRPRIILAVIAVALLIPLAASIFWPARFGPDAPVSQTAMVYVNGADCSFASFLSCGEANRVYGFGGVDGAQRWSISIPTSHLYTNDVSLVAHDGVLYFAIPTLQGVNSVTAARIMAIHGADGAIRWQVNIPWDVSQLVYSNGQVVAYGYSPTGNGVYMALVVDAASGRTLEMNQILQNMTPLAYGDGAMYGCVDIGPNSTAGSNSALAAWSVVARKQLWRRPIEACSASRVSAVSQGVLYLDNYGDHGLVAVRDGDGALLWQALVPHIHDTPPDTALTVGAGVVILYRPTISESGHAVFTTPTDVIALRARDGVMLWQRQFATIPAPGEGTISPPMIVGSTVLMDGSSLAALRVADGATLWQYTRPHYDVSVIGVSGQVIFTAESYATPPNSTRLEEYFTLDYLDAHALATGARYWERNQFSEVAIADG